MTKQLTDLVTPWLKLSREQQLARVRWMRAQRSTVRPASQNRKRRAENKTYQLQRKKAAELASQLTADEIKKLINELEGIDGD